MIIHWNSLNLYYFEILWTCLNEFECSSSHLALKTRRASRCLGTFGAMNSQNLRRTVRVPRIWPEMRPAMAWNLENSGSLVLWGEGNDWVVGTGLVVFFSNGVVLLPCIEIAHTHIYITLIAMISVCCKVRWSMGCSNEGCPKLAERVMDLHSKQCIAILLIIVGFFPLHFLLIHGSGPDICNPRDPELVEGKTGKPSIWLVNDSCFRVKSFQQKQFILQHTDGNK